MTTEPGAAAAARVAAAVAARDLADFAYRYVADSSTDMGPVERITQVRAHARRTSMLLLDRTVLAELLDGATYADIATAMPSLTEDEVRARYGPVVERWARHEAAGDAHEAAVFGDFTPGLPGDSDLDGTAASLDQWIRRHTEAWDGLAERPVSRLLD